MNDASADRRARLASRPAKVQAVDSSFDIVAKLEYVKDKWIDFDLYIQLMKTYSSGNEVLLSLTDQGVKRFLHKSPRISRNEDVSPMGYYYKDKYRRRGKRPRNDVAAQPEQLSFPRSSAPT